MRIKEIISEDLLRASAASGGQKVPIMPPITLYPQPPRPVIPSPAPRMPNSSAVPCQGHRPAAPHAGVSKLHHLKHFYFVSSRNLNLCTFINGYGKYSV